MKTTRKICEWIERKGFYIWDQCIFSLEFIIMGMAFAVLQALGLDSLGKLWLKGEILDFFYNLPEKHRILILIILAIVIDTIIFKPYIKFRIREQRGNIKVVNDLLSETVKEGGLSNYYMALSSIALSINSEIMTIWTNPIGYMKMHIALAILARRNYYCFYTANDEIWKVLKSVGGRQYRDEIKNMNLVHGKRFVEKQNETMSAHDDFMGIDNLNVSYVPKDTGLIYPDFSSFDIGEKYISIRIHSNDSIYARDKLDKTSKGCSLANIESYLNQLKKINYRVQIIISTIMPDWVSGTLDNLERIKIL